MSEPDAGKPLNKTCSTIHATRHMKILDKMARCRYCRALHCCIQHRILHEKSKHEYTEEVHEADTPLPVKEWVPVTLSAIINRIKSTSYPFICLYCRVKVRDMHALQELMFKGPTCSTKYHWMISSSLQESEKLQSQRYSKVEERRSLLRHRYSSPVESLHSSSTPYYKSIGYKARNLRRQVMESKVKGIENKKSSKIIESNDLKCSVTQDEVGVPTYTQASISRKQSVIDEVQEELQVREFCNPGDQSMKTETASSNDCINACGECSATSDMILSDEVSANKEEKEEEEKNSEIGFQTSGTNGDSSDESSSSSSSTYCSDSDQKTYCTIQELGLAKKEENVILSSELNATQSKMNTESQSEYSQENEDSSEYIDFSAFSDLSYTSDSDVSPSMSCHETKPRDGKKEVETGGQTTQSSMVIDKEKVNAGEDIQPKYEGLQNNNDAKFDSAKATVSNSMLCVDSSASYLNIRHDSYSNAPLISHCYKDKSNECEAESSMEVDKENSNAEKGEKPDTAIEPGASNSRDSSLKKLTSAISSTWARTKRLITTPANVFQFGENSAPKRMKMSCDCNRKGCKTCNLRVYNIRPRAPLSRMKKAHYTTK